MGGDLLYRWGNPITYRQGTVADQKMFRQHDVQWIQKGLPNEGKILFFNNGEARGYSTVEMFTTPLNANGTYARTGSVYGPTVYDRTYQANPPANFYSRIMGSAQMQPNGNLLIGSSLQGTTFEIDPNNQILWEYKSPISSLGIVGRTFFPTGSTFPSINIFHSVRYPQNFPAFSGRSMVPMQPIEGEPWADCVLVTGLEEEHSGMPMIHPVPSNEVIHINWKGKEFRATLVDMMGKKLFEGCAQDNLSINTTQIPAGLYLLRTNDQTTKIIVRH